MSDYVMFKEPYFAVVKAAGLDKAIETYERDVSEIEIPDYLKESEENYFFRHRMYKMKESRGKMIQEKHVLAMFHKNEDGTVFESERMLEKTPDNTTVIIDGNLI